MSRNMFRDDDPLVDNEVVIKAIHRSISGKFFSNDYLNDLLNNAKSDYEFKRGKQKAYAKGRIDTLEQLIKGNNE